MCMRIAGECAITGLSSVPLPDCLCGCHQTGVMSAQGLRSVLGNQAERETRQHQSPSSRDRSVVSSALGRLFVTGSKGDCPQYKELEDLTDNAHVGAKHRREREKGGGCLQTDRSKKPHGKCGQTDRLTDGETPLYPPSISSTRSLLQNGCWGHGLREKQNCMSDI